MLTVKEERRKRAYFKSLFSSRLVAHSTDLLRFGHCDKSARDGCNPVHNNSRWQDAELDHARRCSINEWFTLDRLQGHWQEMLLKPGRRMPHTLLGTLTGTSKSSLMIVRVKSTRSTTPTTSAAPLRVTRSPTTIGRVMSCAQQ